LKGFDVSPTSIRCPAQRTNISYKGLGQNYNQEKPEYPKAIAYAITKKEYGKTTIRKNLSTLRREHLFVIRKTAWVL
jgi:hypothetical protein